MSLKKKILMVAGYVVVALIIPSVILLSFVDDSKLYIYLIVFGLIMYTTFGYIIVQNMSVKSELLAVVEELKVQNAALAYRLSQLKKSGDIVTDAPDGNETTGGKDKKTDSDDAEEPTLAPINKASGKSSESKKKSDGVYDDFQ